jgi:hypothetical protein
MKSPLKKSLLAAAFVVVAGLLSEARASFVIDSLDGDITTNEYNNFLSTVTAFTVSTNNYGNAMADHSSGVNIEGIRRMYEATRNTALLDQYIRFCDVFLSHRNDLPGGEHRVMWDGVVEPVWPSVLTTDTYPGYAGCESGQVAGHIAYCAWLILGNSAIWNATVPDGNPNGYGVTYKQRAQTYVSYVDDSLSRYFTPWFVDATTHRIHKPTDSRWSTLAGNQVCTPWNRQMMFVLPYDFSARCHDILNDKPSFLTMYKDVVNQFATWFVTAYPSGGAVYYTAPTGQAVAKWYYEVPVNQNIENIGHAQHDVVGLFESYASGFTSVTPAEIQVYADTTQYVINLGSTSSWAGNVDGTGTAGASLKPDFIFLSEWNRPLYKMIAQSNITANTLNGSEGCKNTGYILYMKHWMAANTLGQVDLTSSFTRTGIVQDGTTFTGGLDAGGAAYSSNLLGATVTLNGATFNLGAANADNSIGAAGQAVALPAAQFSALKLLATGVQGNQTGQIFTVTYTDGTTQAFTQSLSDWFTPQNYAGETTKAMAYRDLAGGTTDNRTFNVYAYSFALNSSKTVSSLTLPNNSNVQVLAITLTTGVAAQVGLTSTFNREGMVTDGTVFTGGLDGGGAAYSATLLGSLLSVNGVTFSLGTANTNNAISAAGQIVALPGGQYSALKMIATGVQGSQTAQPFTVTYTDGTTQSFTQSLSDWFTPQSYAGEAVAKAMAYRDLAGGTTDNRTFNAYVYSFALNAGKTVQSVTLPNNSKVEVLALTLTP